MSSNYLLELPFTRPPLTANQRFHWSQKSRLTRVLRQVGFIKARQAKIPASQRLIVQLHYAPGRRRRIDPMNLTPTSKPLIDGLVDAGIVPDDDMIHVHEETPRVHFPPEPGPRLWLTIFTL